MHVYETGKSPPCVYGWGLSDRMTLSILPHTLAYMRTTQQGQGDTGKGGLFLIYIHTVDKLHSLCYSINPV